MRSSNRPGVLRAGTTAVPTAAWAPSDLATTAFPALSLTRADAERAQHEAALEAEMRARQEIDGRITAAREAGFEDGYRDGVAAERDRLRCAVAAAESALDGIRAGERSWQENVVENLSALAVAIARSIVGRELTTDPTTVAELVKRALAEFPIDQPMRVRVNPEDLGLLSIPSAERGDAIAIAPNRDVRWLADARVERGGCIVEGRERIIDGRVDTALERLYRQLSDTDA